MVSGLHIVSVRNRIFYGGIRIVVIFPSENHTNYHRILTLIKLLFFRLKVYGSVFEKYCENFSR